MKQLFKCLSCIVAVFPEALLQTRALELTGINLWESLSETWLLTLAVDWLNLRAFLTPSHGMQGLTLSQRKGVKTGHHRALLMSLE